MMVVVLNLWQKGHPSRGSGRGECGGDWERRRSCSEGPGGWQQGVQLLLTCLPASLKSRQYSSTALQER